MPVSLSVRVGRSADVARCREDDLVTQQQFEAVGHPDSCPWARFPIRRPNRRFTPGRVLVAEIGGQVVGWIFLTRSDGELCIGQLAVSPPSQCRGVGTSLVDAVIADALRGGERSILLSTQADVEWNQPWYERIGFEVVPPRQWTADMVAIAREQSEAGLDWDTRVHMRMRLTPALLPQVLVLR
ncbi:MAG: GNAT family N-acetyltransferase [Gammaproteobacteria bacterium]|nr:GNAT family N-acetyltransferase [Gammaproteobacteria bacterium]